MSDDAIDSMEAGEPQMETGQWTVLPGGEEKDEEVEVGDDGDVLGGATNDDGGGGASPAANRVITVEECLRNYYPLHYACSKGASLEVIKYLVEEADEELLGEADKNGNYPLHLALERGASLDVIKYLVEEADGDKVKELLGNADKNGNYPLHLACYGGASIYVIKYLVEEADDDKGKELLGKADIFGRYPLHLACWGGASLDVIKYLVEEADGDKGKELLGNADKNGNYPLHLACYGGASIYVIKYLVEKADGDKGKELLGNADIFGRYPLHCACFGGALSDVIKYLVEEADGDKGKELLGKADSDGRYPLHLACLKLASLEVIKYLIEKNPGPLQYKDYSGLTALNYMDVDALRAFLGTHQMKSVADKSSDIDRLNYLTYAQALAAAARLAEQPGTSLCVGLYGRWGGGKSTLWKQIKKFLTAEFLEEDAQLLYNVYQLSGESFHPFSENAKIPFINAVKRLASDPYVLNDAKKAWTEKSEELPSAPLTFLEHLACMFLCIFCACESCGKGYELDNDDRNGNDDQTIQRIQIKYKDARSRRTETNAIFFLVFLVSLFPIWIVYWPIYWTCCKGAEKNDDNIKKEAKQIAGIIKGDLPFGDGDSAHWDVAPCGRFFVIIFLQIVRAIVSGISLACAALHHVVCFQWCCIKTNHTPTGAVKYKIVEFNAWTYQGSELLWASLMKELWDAVEAEFGKEVVRYHRAGIALAGENPYDESHRTSSLEQKARKRKKALLMFRARSYLYLFLFLIVLTVLLTLTITNCKSDNRTCLGKVVNVTNNATVDNEEEGNEEGVIGAIIATVVNITNNATDIVGAVESDSEAEGNDGGVLAAIIATVAAFCPLLANVITFYKKILPYIRKTRGDFLLEKASGSTKRKDFKEELGFMGEVKTELEYLFDLLATEIYLDKEIDCKRSLRLCVFIDDLDRCPKEIVVSVLEAVILLLVDGPISVWMAIDSRIVVQCIEAEKHGVFDKANISGYEFLDKIVQLPFALPELTTDTKISYLDKIVDELDPTRVLIRFMRFLNEGKYESLSRFMRERLIEDQNKGHFFTLTRIATELAKLAAISKTESAFINMVAEHPQNASAEDQENLCFIISRATSQLILNLKGNSDTVPDYPGASDDSAHIDPDIVHSRDEQKTPETDSEGNSDTVFDYPDASDDSVHIDPDIVHSIGIDPLSSGLCIPMLNEDDRRCLEYLLRFIDGNPRRMKRIINSFNLSRRIAELRCGASSPILRQLTSKLLKMVILVEQWPYRMAWLLQLIEDVNQMSTHSVEDSRMNRFLEERLGRKVRRRGESWWDVICSVGILEVYQRVVCELSMSNVDSSNMGAIDSDPQLFEGLLRCNDDRLGEGLHAITVHDLRPLGCNIREGGESEMCLQNYMFNMPQAITDKVKLINYVGKNSSNSGGSEDVTGSDKDDKPKIPGIQESIQERINLTLVEIRELQALGEGFEEDIKEARAQLRILQEERKNLSRVAKNEDNERSWDDR